MNTEYNDRLPIAANISDRNVPNHPLLFQATSATGA